MFGRTEGSVLAAQVEDVLAGDRPVDAAWLADRARRIRAIADS